MMKVVEKDMPMVGLTTIDPPAGDALVTIVIRLELASADNLNDIVHPAFKVFAPITKG